MKLTDESRDLFISLLNNADNWGGTPMFEGTQKQKGNLTDLKKKGLIDTFVEEGCTFVSFTTKGVELARRVYNINHNFATMQ